MTDEEIELELATRALGETFDVNIDEIDHWARQMETSTEAVEGAEAAIDDYSSQLSELQVIIKGALGQEMDNFIAKNQTLEQELRETEAVIAELGSYEYLTEEQSQELTEAGIKLGEAKQSVEELAAKHEEATKRILFSLASQRAGIDGLSEAEFLLLQEMAKEWGLIDQETYEAVQTIDDAFDQLETGNAEGASETIQGLTEDLEGIPDDTVTTKTDTMNSAFGTLADEKLKDAVSGVDELDTKITRLPSQKVIDIHVRTIYSSYGSAGAYSSAFAGLGFQHGGQFTVMGPSGIDNIPVSFMASKGETVTVSPAGKSISKGGDTHVHLTYAPGFSLGSREELETELIPHAC